VILAIEKKLRKLQQFLDPPPKIMENLVGPDKQG
jgi:hypothetical protein